MSSGFACSPCLTPVTLTVACLWCCPAGGSKSQLRLLESFAIHEAGRPEAHVALESFSSSSSAAVATGELLPAEGDDAGAQHAVAARRHSNSQACYLFMAVYLLSRW